MTDFDSVVAVFGYNNVRIYDVMKIRDIVVELYGAKLLLCKDNITPDDLKAADYCCDVSLERGEESNESELGKIKSFCIDNSIKIIGVLPFSDKGVVLGSYVASKFGLVTDDYDKALACLDKVEYRNLENTYSPLPQSYRKPKFTLVSSKEELLSFYEKLRGNIIIKPTSEGNSRGCFIVRCKEDIKLALEEVSNYFSTDVMVEECIEYEQEYSYDQVAGVAWLTEKETTDAPYCAEIQQIVPAPLPKSEYDNFLELGKTMAEISGSKGGAAHNEFLITKDKFFYGVEPNRRPAGSHIWDLAMLAYPDFNIWKAWVRWVVDEIEQTKLDSNKYYAGIRMITAPKSGAIKNIKTDCVSIISESTDEIIEIRFSKKIGEHVSPIVKDNSGFIGHVIARSTEPSDLKSLLYKISLEASACVEVG